MIEVFLSSVILEVLAQFVALFSKISREASIQFCFLYRLFPQFHSTKGLPKVNARGIVARCSLFGDNGSMLALENVSLILDDRKVLDRISFSVKPGEVVAILGSSGAGKSSVFRLLIGEQKPTLGSLKLDDFRLEELSAQSIQSFRRQIGIIFQDFRLLPRRTAAENVAFALEVCGQSSQVSRKVPELLKLVGLQDKADQFPSSLSGGESQRLAIARALIHDPKILIADEPTGNLDPRNSREIAQLFERLHREKNITIVFATHNPVMIDIMKPRVIRLHDGRVAFDEKACPLERAFEGIL